MRRSGAGDEGGEAPLAGLFLMLCGRRGVKRTAKLARSTACRIPPIQPKQSASSSAAA